MPQLLDRMSYIFTAPECSTLGGPDLRLFFRAGEYDHVSLGGERSAHLGHFHLLQGGVNQRNGQYHPLAGSAIAWRLDRPLHRLRIAAKIPHETGTILNAG